MNRSQPTVGARTDRPLVGDANELTRRALLRGAVSSAAAISFASLWGRSVAAAAPTDASMTLRPRPALLTLVNRLTQGYTEAEYQRAQTLGYANYLSSMLTVGVASEPALEGLLSYAETLPWTYADFVAAAIAGRDVGVLRARARIEVANKALYYSALSVNQFKERTVELWRDHFNVYSNKDPVDLFVNSYDRTVLRALATDNFPDLLMAVQKHGAMLTYLDNQLNKAPIANENLAREILELHTAGPRQFLTGAQNYTEADIVAFAKCISGWTNFASGVNAGNFRFKAADHIGGSKTVMGIQVPEDLVNPSEGELVLNRLARPPAGPPPVLPTNPLALAYVTPTFVALKLARWFLDYNPSPSTVTAARNAYFFSSGSITATVAAILTEANVTAVSMPASGGPNLKLRRPHHWMCAALRALQLPTTAFSPAIGREHLVLETFRQGNAAYGWPAPDGYPDREEAWTAAIFSRWFGAVNLLAEDIPTRPFQDVTISDSHLSTLMGPFVSIPASVARLDQILTGGVMTANETTILRTYVTQAVALGTPLLQIQRELFMLGLCTPTFNYY
jgi:hypothetical protein